MIQFQKASFSDAYYVEDISLGSQATFCIAKVSQEVSRSFVKVKHAEHLP